MGPLALYCSDYAQDVGLWAQYNGLCTHVFTPNQKDPHGLSLFSGGLGLSLFHHKESVSFFKKCQLVATVGPRSKISAFWAYSMSVAQHRSRVEKSEMEYNLDLARSLLSWIKIVPVPFEGLPALRIPTEWTSPHSSPDICYVVANRGSATNLPLSAFESLAEVDLKAGLSVDFLVSGLDQANILRDLQGSKLKSNPRFRVWGSFASIKELIVYLSKTKKVVASSTGPLHIAHAAGVPVLGFYPQTKVQSFQRWRPHGYWHGAPVEFRVLSGTSS